MPNSIYFLNIFTYSSVSKLHVINKESDFKGIRFDQLISIDSNSSRSNMKLSNLNNTPRANYNSIKELGEQFTIISNTFPSFVSPQILILSKH